MTFALYEATYPGKDPLDCTLYGLLDRIEVGPYVYAMLHGRYTFEMQADIRADEMAEQFEIKERFKACFPYAPEDDDDG